MTEPRINLHRLTFEQRARATELESVITDDECATAAEIIFLRDRVKELEEMTGPLIGEQRA